MSRISKFGTCLLTCKLIKHNGCFITLKLWLITRVFLQGSLAISIPDEAAAHKRYQPGKCSVRDIQGMSKNNPCLVIMICTLTLFISPLQLRPSPVYPALQVQLYEPWVLTQSALAWHLCVAEVHSLTSNKKTNKQTKEEQKTNKQSRKKRNIYVVLYAYDKPTQLRNINIKINSDLEKKII